MHAPAGDTGFDWSALPEWLTAAGTLVAVGISVYLASRDGQRLKAERAEAAEDRAEFRRMQAQEAEQRMRRLASRVTLSSEGAYNDFGQRFRIYRVHNGGEEPITAVQITERPFVNGELSSTHHVIGNWPIIEGGGQRTIEGRKYEPNESPVVRPTERWVMFGDGLGQRWIRDEFGKLRLASEDPATPGGPMFFTL
ncbi:hypothetical protein GCM10009688_11420 [Arthrobacter gandavensis]|uniref:Uncharacterized protein n=1 Tax=Arthrobacter gandavensis TaxID=169960 RepID=A0ABN2P0A4_9MICC